MIERLESHFTASIQKLIELKLDDMQQSMFLLQFENLISDLQLLNNKVYMILSRNTHNLRALIHLNLSLKFKQRLEVILLFFQMNF